MVIDTVRVAVTFHVDELDLMIQLFALLRQSLFLGAVFGVASLHGSVVQGLVGRAVRQWVHVRTFQLHGTQTGQTRMRWHFVAHSGHSVLASDWRGTRSPAPVHPQHCVAALVLAASSHFDLFDSHLEAASLLTGHHVDAVVREHHHCQRTIEGYGGREDQVAKVFGEQASPLLVGLLHTNNSLVEARNNQRTRISVVSVLTHSR